MTKFTKNKKFIVSLIFSILAFLVSLVSLWISYQNKNISEYSLLINYQPILRAEFETDINGNNCSLNLKNDGLSKIINIHIKKYIKIWSDSVNTISAEIKSKDDWIFLKELVPGELVNLPIEYFDIESTHNFGNNFNKEDFIPFLQYLITFRRYPDEKIFKTRKYLFVVTNTKNKKPMVFDPDSDTTTMFKDVKNSIELFELERQ